MTFAIFNQRHHIIVEVSLARSSKQWGCLDIQEECGEEEKRKENDESGHGLKTYLWCLAWRIKIAFVVALPECWLHKKW